MGLSRSRKSLNPKGEDYDNAEKLLNLINIDSLEDYIKQEISLEDFNTVYELLIFKFEQLQKIITASERLISKFNTVNYPPDLLKVILVYYKIYDMRLNDFFVNWGKYSHNEEKVDWYWCSGAGSGAAPHPRTSVWQRG